MRLRCLMRTVYGNEKVLIRTCIKRPGVYNRQLDILKRLEDEGRIFVIRPTEKTVKRLESDLNELERFYQHGYNTAVKIYDEMTEYLDR